jgi:site-specific recombinase XerD
MAVRVVQAGSGHRLDGAGPITEVANRFLGHLQARGFAASTVRGYAYDLLNLSRFLAERSLELGEVTVTDLFDWLAWQSRPRPRGLFEYAVIVGLRPDSPVPAPRRSSGLGP